MEVIIDDGENGIIDLIIVDKWFLEEMNIVILFILDLMKIMLEKISTMLLVILFMDDFIFVFLD